MKPNPAPRWQSAIQAQSQKFRLYPQIQAMERAVTSVCEIIMNSINEKLSEAGQPTIATSEILNHFDATTGSPRQLGIYTTVQYLVGDEILSHGKINNKPLTKDTIDKLATIMRTLSPEQHHYLVENFFLRFQQQLQHIPECATAEKLFAFVDDCVKEETQNWLQNKPSRLNPEPPRGRAI